MMASKRPLSFASLASFLVSSILERSPVNTFSAAGTLLNACFPLSSLRACSTTWCPWLTSDVAASCPSPSADPVMNILAILLEKYHFHSSAEYSRRAEITPSWQPILYHVLIGQAL